jgi:hypothetical protein
VSVPQIITAGLGSFGTPSSMVTRGFGSSSTPPTPENGMITDLIDDLIKTNQRDIVR